MDEGSIILSGLLTETRSYGAETITTVHKSDQGDGIPMEIAQRYTTDPSWAREIDEFADAVVSITGKSLMALRMKLYVRCSSCTRFTARLPNSESSMIFLTKF